MAKGKSNKVQDGTWVNDWIVESMGSPVDSPPIRRGMIKDHRNQTVADFI